VGVAVAATIYEKIILGKTSRVQIYPVTHRDVGKLCLHPGCPRTERSGYSKVITVLPVISVFVEENRISILDRVYFSNKMWFHVNGYIKSQK